MGYDHSLKVGNQGDLIKHVALYVAIKELLGRKHEGEKLVYADLHSGRPLYVLPEGGSWKHGIGAFSTVPELVSSRKERRERGSLEATAVSGFDGMFLGRPVTTGMAYPGSSELAFRLIRASGRPFDLRLWDLDRAVADDLERHFYPWRAQVTVVCDNGYGIVGSRDPLSLVLIDPPALEAEDLLKTLSWLKTKGTSYVCWSPRTSRSVPPEEEGSKWSAAEAGRSTRFIAMAKPFGTCIRVQWHDWGSREPGCCLTVSPDLQPMVSDALKQVTSMMKWTLEV